MPGIPAGFRPTPPPRTHRPDPFVLYGRVLGYLLAGYLFFDRAFAYLHLPGLPVFIAELVIGIGMLALVRATSTFRDAIAAEPVLALLMAFMAWGVIRTLPGVPEHGLDAARDAALWYYAIFALLAVAAVAARPDLPLVLAAGLRRIAPPLLLWLALSVILLPLSDAAPPVPFTDVSVLSHKPGSAALASLLVLSVLWLVPSDVSRRRRVALSMMALLVLSLAATQNRGGVLGVAAGGIVAIAFLGDRVRVLARGIAVVSLALALALLMSIKVPFAGLQGREFSAAQLVTNFVSLTGSDTDGNLGGTVDGRKLLWVRVLDKQTTDGRLLAGAGFGPNLATEVGIYDDGEESLRNPHNTHLHVFARVGVVGTLLWAGFWVCWYWRMVSACRRLRSRDRYADRQVAGVCLAMTTAVLVSTIFDPQLEGPQLAALLWTLVGIGLAVTGRRRWRSSGGARPSQADFHSAQGLVPRR